MENKLELYHDILFLKLRPLRNRNILPIKYKELRSELQEETYKYQPFFEVDFFKAHTEKAKYYSSLIRNEAIRFYNHIYELINSAIDDEVRTLWVRTALVDLLGNLLSNVSTEIDRLNLPISNIDPSQNHKLKETQLSEETYIYQYLKVQLIQLYLDIQESFEQYLPIDKLDEEDIYLNFFKETAPAKSFIKESERIELPIKIDKPEEQNFKAFYGDIKPITNSKADYNCIYNQTRFADVENNLYEYDIIDIDYNFKKSKSQSNHTLLAAVYKVLIENNYFRRNIIGSHDQLSDLDIRKYLDERYSVDTSQQFRRITAEQIEKAKINLPWLDKIYRIK